MCIDCNLDATTGVVRVSIRSCGLSLRNLCVLCASAVYGGFLSFTAEAQRAQRLRRENQQFRTNLFQLILAEMVVLSRLLIDFSASEAALRLKAKLEGVFRCLNFFQTLPL